MAIGKELIAYLTMYKLMWVQVHLPLSHWGAPTLSTIQTKSTYSHLIYMHHTNLIPQHQREAQEKLTLVCIY